MKMVCRSDDKYDEQEEVGEKAEYENLPVDDDDDMAGFTGDRKRAATAAVAEGKEYVLGNSVC